MSILQPPKALEAGRDPVMVVSYPQKVMKAGEQFTSHKGS